MSGVFLGCEARPGGGSLFLIPPSDPTCRPATAHRWLQGNGEGVGRARGCSEVVLWALSLERACQFIKAFGERGGNLHVT